MEKLNKNWLTEGMIDFEYKKYILLAYLKHIRQNFSENKLYPFLSDLIDHYNYVKKLHDNKDELSNQFPKYLNLEDLMTNKLSYEKLIKDDNLLKELTDIMVFAIDEMEDTVKSGKEVYDIVEENMEIVPIGLASLYQKEGYMLIHLNKNKEVKIFRYQVTIFEGSNDKYRAIHTTYIDTVVKGITTTYEQVRLMLIRKEKAISHPATYLIQSKFSFPFMETVLPVAKRILVKYVNIA
jgi:hypothetical protein